MTSVWIVLGVLAVAGLAALLLRRRDGRVRLDDQPVTLADQHDLGLAADRWTFVEFTAPACAPCVHARAVLDGVAADVDADVLAVDVAQHIEAARHHGVMRAPTTLIVAPGGHVRGRVSGVPHADEVRALVTAAARPAGAAAQ